MLRIKNVVMLDLTELTEETAAQIERIDNCVIVMLSEESARFLNRLAFENVVQSVVVAKGAKLVTVNGESIISPADHPMQKQYLMVNGRLVIQSGVTPDQLRQTLAGGIVNGTLVCTRSQAEVIREIGVNVNGSLEAYPNNAILHDGDLKVDALFGQMAANNSLHYAIGEIIAFEADLRALADKGVTLMGRRMLVYTDALTDARRVFKGDADRLIAIERGMRYVKDELTLDYAALRRLGKNIFVKGDVFISDDLKAEQLHGYLERLVVKGMLVCREPVLDDVLAVTQDFGDLTVYEGRLIRNEGAMELSAASLEGFDEPVSIWSEGSLAFDADVTSELFLEKILGLYIFGAASVPEHLHGRALSRVKRLDGELTPEKEKEQAQAEEVLPPDVKVMGNAVELKLV